MPSIVARPRRPDPRIDLVNWIPRRGECVLKWPICRGKVVDWDDLELLLRRVFFVEVGVVSEGCSVMFCLPPFFSAQDTSRLIETAFEKLHVRSVFGAPAPELVMTGFKKRTGVVIDLGTGVTNVVPVIDGRAVLPAANSLLIGSNDIVDTLMKLLDQRGYCFTTISEREIVREIVEKRSHVALSFAESSKEFVDGKGTDVDFELPDGQILQLGHELFTSAEVLFKPWLALPTPVDCIGLHLALADSIARCDPQFREDLCSKVILCGGNSLLPGISERLRHEVQRFVSHRISITPSPQGNACAWLGASSFASRECFPELSITRSEFDEFGPQACAMKVM